MKVYRHLMARLVPLAAVAALGAAPGALAALHQTAGAGGSYYTDLGVITNTNYGQSWPTADGSTFHFVTCVGSEPNSPDCLAPALPPAPPGAWYELPNQPAAAAAQAWTPDYGSSRVRSWTSGTDGVNTGVPGYTYFAASANSGWSDEITTTSLTPVVITLVVALHVDWNDGGVFGLMMGRPGLYDPDVGGSTPMEGWTWTNCAVCVFANDTGASRTVLPGGANGAVDLVVTMPFTVYPASYADPEDPTTFTNPFESWLVASSSENGAEVQAYSSATLQAILAPPNAGLSFASGHAYNVQVVPEPSTVALWALGLLSLGWLRRRPAR